MGWTSMEKPHDVAAWMKRQLTFDRGHARNECLDVALVRRQVAYAAVRTTYEDGRSEVWAAIFLVKFAPRDGSGLTFSYKDMTEEMGPGDCDCPVRILDRLTPTDGKNANEWRRRAREHHARRERNALRPGDVIRFPSALTFSTQAGMRQYDTFRFDPVGRRDFFMALDGERGWDMLRCRIRSWKDREFARVAPEDVPGAQAPAPR